MTRTRLVGLLALVLAGCAVLVVPRLLAPGVVGLAAADPDAFPPPVGSCLSIEPGTEKAHVVDCAVPHGAEVTTVWPTGHGPDEPGTGQRYGAILMPDDCIDDAVFYTGASTTRSDILWSPIPPSIATRYLRGPDPAGSLYWTACVIGDPGWSDYSGSIRDANRFFTVPRPELFTTCLALGELALRQLSYVPCDQPHRIEMLGSFNVTREMADAGRIDAVADPGQVGAECTMLASRMMNTTDFARLDGLTVQSEALWTRSLPADDPAATDPDPSDAASGGAGLVVPDCFVEYSGPGALTGTVIGIGAGPLPVG